MEKILLAVFTSTVFCVVSVTAVCDSSSSAKIQQCVFQSQLFNPATLPTSESGIRDFCKQDMNVMVDCMQGHLDECPGNAKEQKLMDMLVDIDATRAGMLYMCNNISVIVSKASCFSRLTDSNSNFAKCIQDAVGIITNAVQSGDLQSTMNSLCQFFDSFIGCFTDPFTDDCAVIGLIYGKVFEGVKYPYCKWNNARREAALRDYQYGTIGVPMTFDNSAFPTSPGPTSPEASGGSPLNYSVLVLLVSALATLRLL